MSRLHSLTTTYTPPDEASPEIEVEIYFTFIRGQPERGPTYACGGTPAEPAEVELDHVSIAGDVPATLHSAIDEWASEYLQGAGYDRACEQAAEDLMPDPDAAYERMRNEPLDERYFGGLGDEC